MDRSSLLPFQLWCPRPFGTYSQNQQRPPSTALKPPACSDTSGGTEPDHGPAQSENTPPALSSDTPASQHAPLPSSAAAGDEGRVLLDTWYVIKPGNTKEKVAFFVAHQCGGGSRASSMKVKGHWGSDSSKAKRRRRCLEPTKAAPDPGGRGGAPATEGAPTTSGDDVDLLSVAEMVALVEQRAALALQSYPRSTTQAPVVFVSAEQGAPGKG
ncbi:F-box only protein 46 [Cricetulus griseus]|uniref:F-box only protein 46 n=1 Tax=Cricetulus griseus TaxID=10029 RepID=G3HPF3_CRIGR|nr:F-box only protein 46 [Cricetulus griseus]